MDLHRLVSHFVLATKRWISNVRWWIKYRTTECPLSSLPSFHPNRNYGHPFLYSSTTRNFHKLDDAREGRQILSQFVGPLFATWFEIEIRLSNTRHSDIWIFSYIRNSSSSSGRGFPFTAIRPWPLTRSISRSWKAESMHRIRINSFPIFPNCPQPTCA